MDGNTLMMSLDDIRSFLHRWSDVWDLAAAVGTIAMAFATFRVIHQGKQQRQDGERQHRDRLKPFCVLTPYDGIDVWSKRGALIRAVRPSKDNPSFGTVEIHCVLRNIGVGPARNVRLWFRFLDMQGWSTEPWELAPLAAGASYGEVTKPLLVPFRIQDRFNPTDFELFEGKLWEIWLEYQDIFGNSFQMVHSKLLSDPNPSSFTWTKSDGDAQPKVSLRPIPWLTYPEGPSGTR